MKNSMIGTALGIIALVSLGCSSGSTTPSSTGTAGLSSQMNAKRVVSPVVGPAWVTPSALSTARGLFTGSLDVVTHKLNWQLTYSGMGKPNLVFADIHVGKAGRFGPVMVRLCGPCMSKSPSGQVTLDKAESATIRAGGTWVTVITDIYCARPAHLAPAPLSATRGGAVTRRR
jgi:hypothetical protein